MKKTLVTWLAVVCAR